MERPLRKSSEAPEVVSSALQTPDKFMVSPVGGQGELFPYKHIVREPIERAFEGDVFRSPMTPEFPRARTYNPLSPQHGHDPLDLPPISHFDEQEHCDDRRRNGAISIIAMIIVGIVAFLLGGAVGGGIGGSMVIKEKSKVIQLQSQIADTLTATVTTTAPGSIQTVIYDQAGCPFVNNRTYTSTSTPGFTFLQVCSTDILAAANSGSIDVASSVQTTFDACMDACAKYNTEVEQGGCVGATWVMFSPAVPTHNSMCFLKNATGIPTPATDPQVQGQSLASAFLQA
ncbi:hypothetical protein BJ878DRAFT_273107 [Calycina marina]|uniref:Apple domain-containing protein n=1 Tax=Calycina marina TaxID=1763456 RepID=A0A9P8CB95_9HELO|nr:hypothetical protein BJ878DRAFT_273107 [Calycina marina]